MVRLRLVRNILLNVIILKAFGSDVALVFQVSPQDEANHRKWHACRDCDHRTDAGCKDDAHDWCEDADGETVVGELFLERPTSATAT